MILHFVIYGWLLPNSPVVDFVWFCVGLCMAFSQPCCMWFVKITAVKLVCSYL